MGVRWVQPGEKGVDFSYTKPPPARLVELGITFVVVYYSTPPSNPKKNVEDPSPYLDAGLDVVYVLEKTATRAADGAAAGEEDAIAFQSFLNRIGCPPEAPQMAADDTATTGANVRAKQLYMDSFRNVMPNRGIYAGSKLGRLIDFDLGCLPNAWSWSVGVNTSTAVSRADARQAAINGGYHLIQGPGFYIDNLYPVDPLECVKAFPAWSRRAAPTPPVSQVEDDDMKAVFLKINEQPGGIYLWVAPAAPVAFASVADFQSIAAGLGMSTDDVHAVSLEQFNRFTPVVAPVVVNVPPIVVPAIPAAQVHVTVSQV